MDHGVRELQHFNVNERRNESRIEMCAGGEIYHGNQKRALNFFWEHINSVSQKSKRVGSDKHKLISKLSAFFTATIKTLLLLLLPSPSKRSSSTTLSLFLCEDKGR